MIEAANIITEISGRSKFNQIPNKMIDKLSNQLKTSSSSWLLMVDEIDIHGRNYKVFTIYSLDRQQYLSFSVDTVYDEQKIWSLVSNCFGRYVTPEVLYFSGINHPYSWVDKNGKTINCKSLSELDTAETLRQECSIVKALDREVFKNREELIFFLEDYRLRKNHKNNNSYQTELSNGVVQGNSSDHPDICLIHLLNWFSDSRLSNDQFAPIGSAYIRSSLEQAGYAVEMLLYRHDLDTDMIPQRLQTRQPRIIGISSTGHEIDELKSLSITLKQRFPDVPIIVGGYCSLDPVNLFKDSEIDFVVIGEGEQTVTELVSVLLNDGNPDVIPGIVYRQKNGQLKVNTARKNIEQLDQLPKPDYTTYPKSEKICVVTASRGCPYTCTYCEVKDFYTSKRIRHHSPAYIKSLLKSFKNTNPELNRVFFYDDEFLLYAEHLTGLAGVVKELGMRMAFQTRVRDIISHQDHVKQNMDVISQIQLGVESFCQGQLDRWKKKTQVAHNFEALEILAELAVPYTPLIILSDASTSPEELEQNCDGMLNMPDSAWWIDDDIGSNAKIQIKPFRRPLRLNRLLDFYGRVERDSKTHYLESVWTFLKSSHEDFCNLSTIYMDELTEPDLSSKRQVTVDAMAALLDRRLQLLPEISHQAQKINSAEQLIELGIDYAQQYSKSLRILTFQWLTENSKILQLNQQVNQSSA